MMLVWKATARLSRARAERRAARFARREGGAVAIEAALLTPLLLLLLFGIIEFGMLYKDYLAVTSSVRAGARMASAEPRVAILRTGRGQPGRQRGRALDMGSGQRTLGLQGTARQRLPRRRQRCVVQRVHQLHQVRVGQRDQEVRATSTGTWTLYPAERLQRHPRAAGQHRRVHEVHLPGRHRAIFNEMPLEEHTVMSLEPIPTTKTCK